ncbi:hypothetical protein H0O00_00955 [Candidatus Micrarchaeota archaeon]|nr:hypothetical protein [Candidatus Micrarchaeota archaeon]
MTRYAFSEFSIEWLKQNRFNDDEIDELQDILNAIESHRGKGEPRVVVPKHASARVSAMAYLLDSITDVDGRPICFEANGLIDIPDEARDYFEDDLELEELDNVVGKLKKVKFTRRYSYPKRRGTMKENERSRPF